eukprot:15349455-Ditylum_brightwellii.AAC.2
MSSLKDTEAGETKDSRDTGKVDSGEEPPITNDDERSMPELIEQVFQTMRTLPMMKRILCYPKKC